MIEVDQILLNSGVNVSGMLKRRAWPWTTTLSVKVPQRGNFCKGVFDNVSCRSLSSFRRSYWTSSSLALLRCLVSSGTKVRVERPKAGRARQWMFVNNKYEKKSPLRHSYTHEKASCIWDTVFHISHTSSWRPQILLLFTPLLCVYYTIILYLSFVSIFLA